MRGVCYQLVSSFAVGCIWLFLTPETACAVEPLQFNRDVRPILSSTCFQCHGSDVNNRKAGLRLDEREKALLPAESGEAAIIPGRPEASELVRRVFADNAHERMPPPNSNKSLTRAQKEILRRWVAEGASYERHWAYLPPRRAPLPAVKQSGWARNAVDHFVLSRLEQEGLTPSPEADRTTLFRRLSLDLTGLPPTPRQLDAFEREMTAAAAEDACVCNAAQASACAPGPAKDQVYEKWVDQLLASPHYGERMAVDWLDAARFADTNGYQVDRDREMYAWRDWVIDAFNSNKPFDQFTIEQLAGDLLPEATFQQKVATGFHRNHMLMEEGGAIPEEFLAEYCADRVETTATVWLGQTFTCARCHDHKFDPFTQRDYYGLYAFFHNVTETGIGDYFANIRRNAPPILKLPAPELEAQLAVLNGELGESKKQLAELETAIAAGQAAWEKRFLQLPVMWRPAEPVSARVGEKAAALDDAHSVVHVPEVEPDSHTLVVDVRLRVVPVTALKVEIGHFSEATGELIQASAPAFLVLRRLRLFHAGGTPTDMRLLNIRAADAEKALPAAEVAKALTEGNKAGPPLILTPGADSSLIIEVDPALSGEMPDVVRVELSTVAKANTQPWDLRISATSDAVDLLAPKSVVEIVRKEAATRTADDEKKISDFRNAKDPQGRPFADRIATLTSQINAIELQIPTTLFMQEMATPRRTRILMRGDYSAPGDELAAATPAALPAMSPDLPRNRLGLARWLVDPANPLTARVTVNRFWQSLFGAGLTRTPEDFGIQGEPPTHPELLDWLATEFIRTAWDTKAMIRLLVTSSTYRQESRLTPLLGQLDLENRWLARGPRFRLQVEFVRDQALAASGLLVAKIGGPSVRPYHPPGLYEQVVSGSSADTYVVGKGQELYRRSLYTYWKRSVPNPAMLVFDMPFRETCAVRRTRTNTPLQALNLMNDPTYVEAARCLAQRMVREGGSTLPDQLACGFRLVLARAPRPSEQAILAVAYERAKKEFEADPDGAGQLLQVGDSRADAVIAPAQLAALTTVASTILNLDESVTKE